MDKQVTMNIPNKNVIIKCPCCGKEVAVVAKAQAIKRVEAPVIVDRHFDVSERPFIDWENVDVEADIVFQCRLCGAKLADDLESLFELLKSQHKGIIR